MMITDFDDCVLWMDVLIDDIWEQIRHLYQRPAPQPNCADAELLTMALVGECREWDHETNVLGEWNKYPLNLLMTVGGAILASERMSANADEREVVHNLMETKHDVTVIKPLALITVTLAQELLQQCTIRLLTLSRANQKQQVCDEVRRLFHQVRQISATVNGPLTEPFGIASNHAHRFGGLFARGFTPSELLIPFCICLNRLQINPDWMRIKPLAFPT